MCAVVAVLLWNVTVLFGHPEDAVAVAFAVYAFVFALNGRFAGAGWLFGVALMFQPLVLLMLPVLLAMAGRRYALGMTIRFVLTAAAPVLFILVANVRATLRALIDQPTSPSVNHLTPWTALSPHLSGGLVAAGPVRILGLLFAIGLGVWVYRRWLGRPELLAWSCSLALALRVYTESVMTPYYASAAMVVGVAVAARCSARRFGIAIAAGRYHDGRRSVEAWLVPLVGHPSSRSHRLARCRICTGTTATGGCDVGAKAQACACRRASEPRVRHRQTTG